MMAPALLGAGWAVALVSGVLAAMSWRGRAAILESIARASHELRGPITAARLGLDLVARSGNLAPGWMSGVELELERAALALEDLAGAGARRGRDVVSDCDRRELEMAGLLVQCVEAWQGFAAARGSSVVLAGTARPAVVLGDRLRLAQAVGNLIANAIEHGGGRVSIRCRQLGGSVRIEVTDEGSGLPTTVKHLVRRPRHGRGARGRGLAIADGVAEAHGGRLAAAPSEGGARLVLELPAAETRSGAGGVPGP